MKVLRRCVSLRRVQPAACPTLASACSHPLFASLIPRVRPRSRGITDANVVELMGSRPNVKIMGATQPEALAKYQNADKVLCF